MKPNTSKSWPKTELALSKPKLNNRLQIIHNLRLIVIDIWENDGESYDWCIFNETLFRHAEHFHFRFDRFYHKLFKLATMKNYSAELLFCVVHDR